jgi:hypothetical protein
LIGFIYKFELQYNIFLLIWIVRAGTEVLFLYFQPSRRPLFGTLMLLLLNNKLFIDNYILYNIHDLIETPSFVNIVRYSLVPVGIE